MEINNFEYLNYYPERFAVGEHRPNRGPPPPTPANGPSLATVASLTNIQHTCFRLVVA